MTPKFRVIAAHPQAYAYRVRTGWMVAASLLRNPLGVGATARAAWADAASKLGDKP